MKRKSPRAHRATETFDQISFPADSSKNNTAPRHFQESCSARPGLLDAINRRVLARLARHCQISNGYARTVASLIIEGAD